MSHFSFQIVTPERIAYEDDIAQVTVPTRAGEITILSRHTPIVSTLKPGELRIKKNDNEVHMAVSHGFVEVRDDGKVIVMAQTAERPEEIDVEAARKARERAREILEKKDGIDEKDFARFEAIIEREIARISIGEKYQGRK